MAGYEPEQTTYHLDFGDTTLKGLEVAVHAPPLGVLADVVALMDGDAAEAMKMFEMFAGYLVSWNITRGGKPVPATYEGMLTQEVPLIIKIIQSWAEAMADVDPTQHPGSPAGATQEASMEIPMDPMVPAS